VAARGAEGSNETTKEGAALVERRLMRPVASRVSRPCLVICTACQAIAQQSAEKDFVHHRTDDGKAFWTLNILDEHSRECLAIRVKRKLNSTEVIDALTDLFILRGVPAYIRSDNGPEFIAQAVRDWIAAVGAKTASIEPGSPWENGYCESFGNPPIF